jgi:hypothetical protein
LLNKTQFEDIDDQCSNARCPADLRDDAETGRLYQTVANVSLGVGVVGLATGLYFLLSGDSVSVSTDDEGAEVAVGPSELWLRGRF